MSLLLAAILAAPLVGAAAAVPQPQGKIVLVALSGPEDVQKLMGPYHHAVIAELVSEGFVPMQY